jgi:hypothetical protein
VLLSLVWTINCEDRLLLQFYSCASTLLSVRSKVAGCKVWQQLQAFCDECLHFTTLPFFLVFLFLARKVENGCSSECILLVCSNPCLLNYCNIQCDHNIWAYMTRRKATERSLLWNLLNDTKWGSTQACALLIVATSQITC